MFNSPTHGRITDTQMRKYIVDFLKVDKEEHYRMIVGTDSQSHLPHGVDFISAVIVHRRGHGGVYFWRHTVKQNIHSLRQRMYEEALLSLQVAEELVVLFENYRISRYNIEIHVDIGQQGETKHMINEIVGMIRGSGYNVKTKPESYGASKVADRHTK